MRPRHIQQCRDRGDAPVKLTHEICADIGQDEFGGRKGFRAEFRFEAMNADAIGYLLGVAIVGGGSEAGGRDEQRQFP